MHFLSVLMEKMARTYSVTVLNDALQRARSSGDGRFLKAVLCNEEGNVDAASNYQLTSSFRQYAKRMKTKV